LRVVACRAECSCGRRAACQQFRFGGSEFDARDGNPAPGHGDPASQYRNSPGWNGDPSCRHRNSAITSESECSGLELNQRNDAEEHDSGNRARFKFAGKSDSRKQHTTLDGKSEYSEQSGNNTQRISLRDSTRHTGSAQRLESKFWLVEFGFVAGNTWEQFGQ
jgi:hypothetical protein